MHRTRRARVLECIVEKNLGEPAEKRFITHHERRPIADSGCKLHVANRRDLVLAVHHATQSLAQINGLNIEDLPARIGACHFQQLFNQTRGALGFRKNVIQ